MGAGTHPPPRVVSFLEGMSSLQGSDKVRRGAEQGFVARCLLRARLAMATWQMPFGPTAQGLLPAEGRLLCREEQGPQCAVSPFARARTSPGGGATALPRMATTARAETGLGCGAHSPPSGLPAGPPRTAGFHGGDARATAAGRSRGRPHPGPALPLWPDSSWKLSPARGLLSPTSETCVFNTFSANPLAC